MRIGIMLEAQFGLNWERWKNILRLAEDYGYESVFRSDHYVLTEPPDQDSLELWISLTYAAIHTKRIEFGAMVAPVTFRHPVLTAKMGAQVDDLSGGRLVQALGAGWCEREHTMFGIPFYDTKTRLDMFEEALEITTLLYQHDEPVSYRGKHFSLQEAVLLPRPARPGGPPILVGGGGPKRTIPLAAKYASEWNIFGSIPTFLEKSALLDEHLRKEGRQPEDVRRSVSTNTVFATTEAEAKARIQARKAESAAELWARGVTAATHVSELIDRCHEWEAAGVDRLLLQWLPLDDLASLELIGRDVLPHFHRD